MSDKTKIQWTDASWNPLNGCSRISAGCMHCYAERQASRFSGAGQTYDGLTLNGKWTGNIRLNENKLIEPLRWKKPRRVFVNSMSDLFHENVPDEWIDRIFAVMALASQHTFQVLTKRPGRMHKYFAEDSAVNRVRRQTVELQGRAETGFYVKQWPLPNVWLGVSVEDQKSADARIPLLLDTPAAIRFVSYEPALDQVDFNRSHVVTGPPGTPRSFWQSAGWLEMLHWVIVGGESGPGARRFDPAWARGVVQQCKAAGVACFVKQMGSDARTCHETLAPGEDPYWTKFLNRKGDDPEQWPEDLRVREFPSVEVTR